MRKATSLLGVMFLLFSLSLITGCTRINAGHVGVEINLAGSQRGASEIPLRTGWVWYNPLATTVVEYPTFVQTAVWTRDVNEGHPSDESITFTTKDAMAVSADISMSYSLKTEKVPDFYVKFRTDDLNAFTHGFLRNLARDSFNEVASNYTVDEIMGAKNTEFVTAVRAHLQQQVAGYGVNIDQFGIIGAPRPPDAVILAINMKVQATQLALQKQNEVAQAEADARKRVAQADGEANASVRRAEGEARANDLLTRSITPQLVEWRRLSVQQMAIEKWNGQRPTVEVNSGAGQGLLLQLPVQK